MTIAKTGYVHPLDRQRPEDVLLDLKIKARLQAATKWEPVYGSDAIYEKMDRMRVEGGWLYRHQRGANMALAFVPDQVITEYKIETVGDVSVETGTKRGYAGTRSEFPTIAEGSDRT